MIFDAKSIYSTQKYRTILQNFIDFLMSRYFNFLILLKKDFEVSFKF